MKIKTYLLYGLLLPIFVAVGVGALFLTLLFDTRGIFWEIILYLGMALTVSAPPLMTFTFSKRVIMEAKRGFVSVLAWWIYVFVASSAVVCVLLGEFSTDIIWIGLLIFTVPSVVSSILASVIYSKSINLQSFVEQKANAVRTVIETAFLCLGTTFLIFVWNFIYSMFNFEVSMLCGGLMLLILFAQSFSAFVYGYNRFKKTKAFPKLEAIFVLAFSSVSTAVVLVINLIADKFSFEFDELMEEIIIGNNMYALLIVFIVVPAVTLCLGALLAKCTSNKKVSE